MANNSQKIGPWFPSNIISNYKGNWPILVAVFLFLSLTPISFELFECGKMYPHCTVEYKSITNWDKAMMIGIMAQWV